MTRDEFAKLCAAVRVALVENHPTIAEGLEPDTCRHSDAGVRLQAYHGGGYHSSRDPSGVTVAAQWPGTNQTWRGRPDPVKVAAVFAQKARWALETKAAEAARDRAEIAMASAMAAAGLPTVQGLTWDVRHGKIKIAVRADVETTDPVEAIEAFRAWAARLA